MVAATYTKELAEMICDRIAAGESLRSICAAMSLSEATVRRWAVDDHEGFAAQYARARAIGLDCRAEGTREIAADQARDPQCRKVELDNERWLLSKLRPEVYGDRLAHQMLDDKGKPSKLSIEVHHVGREYKP
jgi:hypothetical protein